MPDETAKPKITPVMATALHISQPIVILWRDRYEELEAAERELALLKKAQQRKQAKKRGRK